MWIFLVKGILIDIIIVKSPCFQTDIVYVPVHLFEPMCNYTMNSPWRGFTPVAVKNTNADSTTSMQT